MKGQDSLSNNFAPLNSPYAKEYGLRFPESPIVTAIYQFLGIQNPNKRIRILDVGCGLGNHALLLETLDAEYVGIDVDLIAIERARIIFSDKPYADKIQFKNTSIIDYSLESHYPHSFTVIIDRASLQHNSIPNLISDNGIIARIALGLDSEKGILVSYWASKNNNLNSMSQRFPIFTGFEDISADLKFFFDLLLQKRITVQEEGINKGKKPLEIITNFLSVWKVGSTC